MPETDNISRIRFENVEYWAQPNEYGYDLLEGDPFVCGFEGLKPAGKHADSSEVILLPPTRTSKVMALAYNYGSLVGEDNLDQEPLVFFKSPTGLTGNGAVVTVPAGISKVWVEVEMALVIGKGGKDIDPEEAGEHVLGHTIGNDITAQNVHGRDHHLARSKGLDGFCPLGPVLRKGLPVENHRLRTMINGVTSQDGRLDDRILDDRHSVSLVSKFVTLEPGDVILTGTPAGAMDSLVKDGDQSFLEIEGLGILNNTYRFNQN